MNLQGNRPIVHKPLTEVQRGLRQMTRGYYFA